VMGTLPISFPRAGNRPWRRGAVAPLRRGAVAPGAGDGDGAAVPGKVAGPSGSGCSAQSAGLEVCPQLGTDRPGLRPQRALRVSDALGGWWGRRALARLAVGTGPSARLAHDTGHAADGAADGFDAVQAAVRALTRLEGVGETLRQALNVLAEVAPDWLRAQEEALRAARAREPTTTFAAAYALRAGVESTQALRVCGVRRARYLGQAKTHLQHILSAVALGLLRIAAWLDGTPLTPTPQSSFARLMTTAA
jgi:hypothetical protein